MTEDLKNKNWHVLDIPEGTVGDYAIKHMHEPAGAKLSTGNMRTSLFGQPSVDILFEQPTRWHELLEEGGRWMSDLPIEQAQADKALENVHGKILVGGLGLGYAATHLCRNPDVDHITVVEISSEVIELVEMHLTLTPGRGGDMQGKMDIWNGDLFDFLRVAEKSYDYCFFDIWQSDGEGTFWETVVPLRNLTQGICDDENIICWNENVMRAQLVTAIMSRVYWINLPKEQLNFIGADKCTPTLDDLCIKRDDKYWDWMVPYWEDYRSERFDREDAQVYARDYCELVGRPGWEEEWAQSTI